jgi:hypothetical protein
VIDGIARHSTVARPVEERGSVVMTERRPS